MGKGSTARYRGPTRAGVRDTPAALRQTLEMYLAHPALLDGLPPAERELRRKQIVAYQARCEMRSEAAKAGHVVRRQRETERLVDLLGEAIERGDVDEVWGGLSAREQALVDDWLEQDLARKRSTLKGRPDAD
jgi:hypothetical protein